MALIDEHTKQCTFKWKIENASQCWWMPEAQEIVSPIFEAGALLGTSWSLRLIQKGYIDEKFISIYLQRAAVCSGSKVIRIHFKLAFLGKDGSSLIERNVSNVSFARDDTWGFDKFVCRNTVFVTEREAFLPEDSLTVQCKIIAMDNTIDQPMYLYGRTVVKVNRKSFLWTVQHGNTLIESRIYEFRDALFHFRLILKADVDKLDLDLISWYDMVEYISFNVSVIDWKGKRVNCGTKFFFGSDLKKGVYLVTHFPKKVNEDDFIYYPNGVLSLDIEFAFATIEGFGCENHSCSAGSSSVEIIDCPVRDEKSQNITVMIEDFKSQFNESIFNDTEIRTSTKTFPAHKGILSARSPVFKRMFSNDMKDGNIGHVVISDFSDDTVHRMLLYIYTSTIEDLEFESASELYKIADKFHIPSLKSTCSSFLKDNICPIIACDVLILADNHHDVELKNAAETYILEHVEVFNTMEWKHLMYSNVKLAADIMFKKVISVGIYEGNM